MSKCPKCGTPAKTDTYSVHVGGGTKDMKLESFVCECYREADRYAVTEVNKATRRVRRQ